MILQVGACATVVMGCGMLGLFFANSFKRRIAQLIEFQNVIKQLEFDIEFLNIPIKRSLKRISKTGDCAVRAVLEFIVNRLESDRCNDMYAVWKRGIERYGRELDLTDDDIKILLDFSKMLGCGDKLSEMNNIKATMMRLKSAEDDARCAATKNVKMYRGLGFLTGIFIVLVLF